MHIMQFPIFAAKTKLTILTEYQQNKSQL